MEDTISDYCISNTLLIPQSLFDMSDAHVVMAHRDAAIFYKQISRDMKDIEFFTNTPCLAFVLCGTETFTSYNDQHIRLNQHEMLFMPGNTFLVSDFVNENGPLKAFLFFFDADTINQFKKKTPLHAEEACCEYRPCKIKANRTLTSFMHALYGMYRDLEGTPELLRVKLLELLFLIDALDDKKCLRTLLTSANANSSRRSIRHLMREYRCYNLSVNDFAKLSGRSPSSFNRDFKRQFGITPQQWLIGARLERAMELIQDTEMSITEISLEIGYENISHFIKTFKAKYGLTPKQERSKKYLLEKRHFCNS